MTNTKVTFITLDTVDSDLVLRVLGNMDLRPNLANGAVSPEPEVVPDLEASATPPSVPVVRRKEMARQLSPVPADMDARDHADADEQQVARRRNFFVTEREFATIGALIEAKEPLSTIEIGVLLDIRPGDAGYAIHKLIKGVPNRPALAERVGKTWTYRPTPMGLAAHYHVVPRPASLYRRLR